MVSNEQTPPLSWQTQNHLIKNRYIYCTGCETGSLYASRYRKLCHSPMLNFAQCILSSLHCAISQPNSFLSVASEFFLL